MLVNVVPLKTCTPSVRIVDGSVILVIFPQFSNALLPIVSSPSGQTGLLRETQSMNAFSLILVTLSGILTVSSFDAPFITFPGIVVMPDSKTASFTELL